MVGISGQIRCKNVQFELVSNFITTLAMQRSLTVLYITREATVHSIAQEPVDNELGWL